MLKPKEVIISITTRCNSRCRMCDIPSRKTEELTTRELLRLLRELSVCGVRTVVFSGGEPLIREDIFDLISYAKVNRMAVCLTSNGYCLDDVSAYKLSETGVDVVNISVEGAQPVHDFLRGNGAFDKAMAALQNLRKYKIEATIATMVSRYNYRELSHIAELAKENDVTTVKFQPFSGIFLDNKYASKDFVFDGIDFQCAKEMITEVLMRCDKYGIATNPKDYLENIPSYLCGKTFPCSGNCSALLTSCPINVKGEIFPCWSITDKNMLIGNIKENAFSNIWNQRRHLSIIEKINKNGCPGCMMSCYDERFGKERIKQKLSQNMKRLQNKGFPSYMRNLIKRWKMRFRFYVAYRISFKEIMSKVIKLVKKTRYIRPVNYSATEIEYALKKIQSAKQRLKREVASKT